MDPTATFPPEYIAAKSSGHMIKTCIAFIVLETLFVGLFIAARLRRKMLNSLDTYLIVLGLPFCLAEAALPLGESNGQGFFHFQLFTLLVDGP
jgi:hypothetical protein